MSPDQFVERSPQEIQIDIEGVLKGTRCSFCGFGPNAVAVMGDARFYGPSIFVKFASTMTKEQIGAMSNRLTNEVRDIARVMMEVVPQYHPLDLEDLGEPLHTMFGGDR